MEIPTHPKLRGEWAEVHFLARASEMGLHVSKPYGDCLPYDFIVENGGRMLRVQVKATSYKGPEGNGYKCHVRATRAPRFDALDFLAAYIIPDDVWYTIPAAELAGKRFIALDPHNERNRYRRYLEAWDLLLTEPLSEVCAASEHPL